jgi:hypothetical protein
MWQTEADHVNRSKFASVVDKVNVVSEAEIVAVNQMSRKDEETRLRIYPPLFLGPIHGLVGSTLAGSHGPIRSVYPSLRVAPGRLRE